MAEKKQILTSRFGGLEKHGWSNLHHSHHLYSDLAYSTFK